MRTLCTAGRAPRGPVRKVPGGRRGRQACGRAEYAGMPAGAAAGARIVPVRRGTRRPRDSYADLRKAAQCFDGLGLPNPQRIQKLTDVFEQGTLPPPGAWRSAHDGVMSDMETQLAVLGSLIGVVKGKGRIARIADRRMAAEAGPLAVAPRGSGRRGGRGRFHRAAPSSSSPAPPQRGRRMSPSYSLARSGNGSVPWPASPLRCSPPDTTPGHVRSGPVVRLPRPAAR